MKLRLNSIENRIYIRVEFTRAKCKIFLYCFHSAGVLHIFVLYCRTAKLLGPGTSFYRKSKMILKENQVMK